MPDGRMRASSSRSRAAKRSAKSMVWPSTLTSTSRSNQSLPPRGSVAVDDRQRDEGVLGSLAQRGVIPDDLDVDVGVRLQPGEDLGEQDEDGGSRHRQVTGPTLEVGQRGEQVHRQLQLVDGGLLRDSVTESARELPQGMVHDLVAPSVARRPSQRRCVECGALDAQEEPLEPAGGEGDAAVGGTERRMAGQRRLVQVEQLVDVMRRNSECPRWRRGEPRQGAGEQREGAASGARRL